MFTVDVAKLWRHLEMCTRKIQRPRQVAIVDERARDDFSVRVVDEPGFAIAHLKLSRRHRFQHRTRQAEKRFLQILRYRFASARHNGIEIPQSKTIDVRESAK